jgi:putative addiction module component (TIGR02574 family)
MSGGSGKPMAFDEMSTDEQILYVQDLWDAIAAKAETVPVPPEQRAELRRRLAMHQADPAAVRPWHEVRADIEKPRP